MRRRKLGLGIRAELTQSSFNADDARGLLERLHELYKEPADSGQLVERQLRQIIRPAYRYLIELLPGITTEGILAGAPLLVHNGDGQYKFLRSDQVLYVDRGGTRDRLGTPEDLWTFVLESVPAARAPLTSLLKVRVLEDELVWTPQPGDPAFDTDGEEMFRAGVQDLGPYILARLGAERQDERSVEQDSRRLRDFLDVIQPVTELSVRCRLGHQELAAATERNAFVEVAANGPPVAFVVWGSRPWPPSTDAEAEALGMALSDVLRVRSHFEAFLALIKSTTHESRLKLLRLAGAHMDLETARVALKMHFGVDANETDAAAIEAFKSAGELTSEEAAVRSFESDPSKPLNKTPLFRPEELSVSGVPIGIIGDVAVAGSGVHSVRKENGSDNGDDTTQPYGGFTDLVELDRLGMYVALTFERARLQREGVSNAVIFDVSGPGGNPDALIFDVSTLGAVDRARVGSRQFSKVFSFLEQHGLNMRAPGFDILTLDPRSARGVGRLIELKSSGVNARIQEMSWNEWKTARNSTLRPLFYLYLVGNLRSDLGDSVPFIRAVCDPFASILAEEVEQASTVRKIQLNVTQFTAAEHLDLEVRRAALGTQDHAAFSVV